MFTILLIFGYIFIAAIIKQWSKNDPELKQHPEIYHKIFSLFWIIAFPIAWLCTILKDE